MYKVLALSLILALTGCTSAGSHLNSVRSDKADRMTVGKVQKEIKVGMSSGDVASVLGSPNIVSTDEQRREVWIYDKVSTETAYSKSDAGATILILGGFKGTGATSTNQRTLTVIVKFDNNSRVRDFAYHTSTF